MSTFRVNLNNSRQGMLDINPSTASQFSTSIQRTIYIEGPNRQHRKLSDGETFVDSNYWKRFAYPQMSLEDSFIEVVIDDGSAYSDIQSENNFPKVYHLTVSTETSYAENEIDIAEDTESYAHFVQITNKGSSSILVKLNGVESAIFELAGSETQVFNSGDLLVTKIAFDNNISGNTDCEVQVLCSIKNNNRS